MPRGPRRWPWLAPGEPDPPPPPPPSGAGTTSPARTARGAILGLGLVLLALGVLARGCMGQEEPPMALERHARLGPQAGAEALRRELLEAHPEGSALAPLLDRLGRLGFDCAPAFDPSRGADAACLLRASRPDRRLLRIAVAPDHDGVTLRGLTVRMGLDPPSAP